MNNSGNFILKVHIQDNDLKEVFLNKDKRCFTFINDECVADLILPEFKLTSLKMLIKNVVDDKKNDDICAEYNNEDTKIYEYDKEKVNILCEMVTNITIKDFLEYIDRVKQNDFYIDSIVDIYNATIPEEVKRLISYSTNGFKFNESEIRMLAHEEIMDSDFRKDKFIPIFECDNTFFGYDLKERRYARYVDGSIYKYYDKLDELLDLNNVKDEEEIEEAIETPVEVVETVEENHAREKLEDTAELEIIDVDENEKEEKEVIDEEESLFTIISEEDNAPKEEVIPEIVEEEKQEEKEKEEEISEKEKAAIKEEIDEEYNKTIDNINDQFEKLNTQVEIEEEPKNKYEIDIDTMFSNFKADMIVNKDNPYKTEIETIVEEAKEEVAEEDSNPDKMDIDERFKETQLEKKKQETNPYKIDLDKLFKEAQLEAKKKKEENAYEMDIESLFSNYKMELNKKIEEQKVEEPVPVEKVEEVEETLEEVIEQEKEPELDTNYTFVPKVDVEESIDNQSEEKIPETNYKLGKADLYKTRFDIKIEDNVVEDIEEKDISKEAKEEEFSVSKEITDNIRDSVKKSLKKIEKEELAEIDLERIIDNTLTDSVNNYRIGYNDSMKLVVEHIPYYQNDNTFGVVTIPELEVNKYTLLPECVLDFDKIKFNVISLSDDKVELLIEKATNIVNESGDKIKKGDIVKMNSESELVYLLNKKDAMESWTIRIEKVVYEKELRHIEYNKLMNLIKYKTNYETLANIEKIETQKSIMLFVNSIMKKGETNKLDEIFEIIKNGDNYAKYVTEYNNEMAHNDKDSLPSYEHKKDFLEKLKYVNTLISTDALTYPRYIYASFNYFNEDQILEDYLEDINDSIKENDFSNYLKSIFKQNSLFSGLDDEGKDNLNKCLEYLSALYKHHPIVGEEDKYKIESTLIISLEDEDMALLISKLCRKGIKDYNSFKEYDSLMKEEYRTGNLKYPLYSEDFDIEEVRKSGDYDE